MPIYAYRCGACGHAQDVLQKMSDPLLVTCPQCNQDTYEKQVTAAAFHLKGTGWYVTDFKGDKQAEAPPAAASDGAAAPAAPGAATGAATESATPASAAAPSTPTPAQPAAATPAATAD